MPASRSDPIPIPTRRLLGFFVDEALPLLLFALGVIVAVRAWPGLASAPSVVGEAERIEAVVKPLQAGRLVGIDVKPDQPVKAGEVLARIRVVEPAIVEATLARIRAELDHLRASRAPLLDLERTRIDAERLQLEFLRERVNLATLRARQDQAAAVLARLEPLHRQKLVAEEEHERARLQLAALAQEVTQQAALVEALGPAIARREAATPASSDAAFRAALAVQEKSLQLAELQFADVPLCAPMDGVVSALHRRLGENVAANEPVLVIASPHASHLVAYLRQPIRARPRVGAAVEIRLRDGSATAHRTELAAVAPLLEPVPPTLRLATSPHLVELGLRLSIPIPPSVQLRPGEHVEVRLR